MQELFGIAALSILVATEAFAFSEAVLWATSAIMHLGVAAQNGTFILSAILGLAAGFWIWRSALAHRTL